MFSAIKHITLTLPTPAENLACDEALLDACEVGGGQGGVLRFWESPDYFVVVGYGNKVADDVDEAACAKLNVPILRRCSGGGTVVQGPGCLNYSLILPIDETGPLSTITAANKFIMEKNRAAIQTALDSELKTKNSKLKIFVAGHTDLALDGLKFSGNSQRRRKNLLLFHGTFLLNFDLSLIGKLLPMPSLQPDYRQKRSHAEFVTNLNLPADAVKKVLQSAWNATAPLKEILHQEIATLVSEKYSTAEWNLR